MLAFIHTILIFAQANRACCFPTDKAQKVDYNNLMTKQRFTSADVAGEAACLRARVLGMRLANLYDIDAKVREACGVHMTVFTGTE